MALIIAIAIVALSYQGILPLVLALAGLGMQTVAKDRTTRDQQRSVRASEERQRAARDQARRLIMVESANETPAATMQQQYGQQAAAQATGDAATQDAISLFEGGGAAGMTPQQTKAISRSAGRTAGKNVTAYARYAAPGRARAAQGFLSRDVQAQIAGIDQRSGRDAAMLPRELDLDAGRYADLYQLGGYAQTAGLAGA